VRAITDRLLSVLLSLITALPVAAYDLQLQRAAWSLDTESGTVTWEATEEASESPGLVIRDGKADADLEFVFKQTDETSEGLELRSAERDGHLRLTQNIRKTQDRIVWEAHLENRGQDERWLQVELLVPTGIDDGEFWDGFNASKLSSGSRTAVGLNFRFPAAAVYGDDFGVALGINPEQKFSYIGSEVETAGAGSTLGYLVRIIVPPGGAETVEFTVYDFPNNWQWKDAVQRFYDFYPDCFWPAPNIDPRIVGPGRYLRGSNEVRDLQMEEARRLLIGWDWAYAPFQTPGDWYPDERFWDNEKGYPGSRDRHLNAVKGPIEEYRRSMRIRFHQGRNAAAILFYVLPQQCEWALLDEVYRDALWIGPGGEPVTNTQKGWVKTDSNTALAWPWNNSYGEAILEDFRRIVDDFKPSGFAFDTCHGGRRYYGPAQEGMEGRAWDDAGAFVDISIALSNLLDWVHQQEVEGHRLGAVLNGPYVYTLSQRSDSVMFEPSPARFVSYWARQWPVRLLAGHKPIVWHKGYPYRVPAVIDWEKLPPAEIRDAFRGLEDFTLLRSLYLGAIPTCDFRGIPKMIHWGRILTELTRAGWQPVPAVRTDERLWTSRYGEGLSSYLVVSNPTREPIKSQLEVSNRYLHDGPVLLTTYDGEAVQCRFQQRHTSCSRQIGGHQPQVLRVALGLSCDGEVEGDGWVTYDPYAMRPSVLKAQFSVDSPTSATVSVRLPKGVTVEKVEFNAREIGNWASVDNGIQFEAGLAKANRVDIHYLPEVFVRDSKAVASYPFVKGGGANCSIVLAHSASETQRVAASHLAVYFDYYFRRKKHPGGVVWDLEDVEGPTLPIVAMADEYSPADLGDAVLIGDPSDHPLIQEHIHQRPEMAEQGFIERVALPERDILIVSGESDEQISEAMEVLFSILDERYPFFGILPDSEVYEKAGLARDKLTWPE